MTPQDIKFANDILDPKGSNNRGVRTPLTPNTNMSTANVHFSGDIVDRAAIVFSGLQVPDTFR